MFGPNLNTEHTDLCVGTKVVQKQGATKSDEALHFDDCRLSKGLICLQSLYLSTFFMNLKSDIG